MKVEQLMTRTVKVCRDSDTLNRAAQLMWESDCGFIPVISADGDGRIVGVITDRDIAIAAYTQGRDLAAIPVTTAMARKVLTCKASDGISQAEALMRDSQVRRLPVLDEKGNLVGVISLNDIAREAQREARSGGRAEVTEQAVAETLAAVCTPHQPRELSLAS
jgi:CBS domain-containing protein